MSKVKIKTGDKVRVTTGEHKGSEGVVTKILKDKNRVIVEGVNMVSKHEKPSATNPQGGIKELEAPLHISNVSLIDSDGKSTKVGYKSEDGKKVRFAKTNNQAI
ncbi:LSU ribosomal protein L24p [Nonlabens tegetincola]|uniref:Large ribosomal subunit protein uL24 n=1 Tax=Nonlabens tegetincola TaxID=323273 RepID=A0A090Q2L1_9FLAO|nr:MULTISPECIES: 50S ribosomal protein L24 [Nonlabens]ALM20451.1 50S ribosomal protein L24 [Nonlabens sp. MIC269]ARN70486.1 50S ribosomal protein L24 [Nonlabens tegetincola]GAK97319.1 LSU ribosomal protein L24p [Nonlabens tegetincola]